MLAKKGDLVRIVQEGWKTRLDVKEGNFFMKRGMIGLIIKIQETNLKERILYQTYIREGK